MSLGENLSETGKSDGLTREAVAETLGVSANKPVDYVPQLKEIERVIEKNRRKDTIQGRLDEGVEQEISRPRLLPRPCGRKPVCPRTKKTVRGSGNALRL